MSKTRKASRNGHAKAIPIVAPGLRGAEDYLGGLARNAGERGVFAAASSVIATRDVKGLIAEVIAEANGLGTTLMAFDPLEWLMQQYRVSLWIYACIRQIATNMASVPLVAEVRDGPGWKHDPDSEPQAIFDAPATQHSTNDLIEQISTYMETCGSELIVAERKHGDPDRPTGPIIGFTALRPSRVSIVPGGNFADRYEHNVGGKVQKIHVKNGQFIRYFDPLSDYWGLSPITLLQREIDIDQKIEEYNQATLKNGGVPEMALTSEQPLQRGNSRRIKREFEQNYMANGKNGGVVVLDSGLKLAPVGIPPKDMQFKDSAQLTMHRMLSAFGVPPIFVMDLTDASVLANADAQIEMFYKFTLKSKSRPIEQAFTRQIQQTYGAQWRVRFAFERSDAMKDDALEKDDARKNYEAGIITLDEARAVGGLAPAKEGGDEFKAPKPTPGFFDEPTPGKHYRRRVPHFTQEFKALARTAYRRQFDAAQDRLKAAMRAFFQDQRARVLRAFEAVKPELGASGAIGTPTIELLAASAPVGVRKGMADRTFVSRLFDTAAETKQFIAEVGPVFLAGLVGAANEKMRQLAPSTKAALKASHIPFQDFYARWGATKVKDIQETTRHAIRDAVQYGFDNGLSTREIESQIEGAFKELVDVGQGDPETETDFPEHRLERIARTETNTMLNTGSFEGVRELAAQGANIVKSWLSARDELVRDSHEAIDDETSSDPIPITASFSNGLMFPGDPNGAAGEVINCFLPGTKVSGRFVGGVKSRYSGPARQIRTVSGRVLRVTPNHPVMTAKGMVTAGSIQNGSQLLCGSVNVERGMERDVDHDQAPSFIEDAFEALAIQRGIRSSMVRGLDLHGDARHVIGKVDVAGSNCKLRNQARDLGSKFSLELPNSRGELLHRSGARILRRDGIALAAASAMSSVGLLDARAARHARPLDPLRIGAAADWYVALSEDARQGGAAYSEFMRELLEAGAGEVALDHVVEVRDFDWSGHVFDLQSEDGWILSDGIVCSNCRCSLIEVVLPEGE